MDVVMWVVWDWGLQVRLQGDDGWLEQTRRDGVPERRDRQKAVCSRMQNQEQGIKR